MDTMLTSAQRDTFRDRGVIRVPHLLDTGIIGSALEPVWQRLAKHGVTAASGWRAAGVERASIMAGANLLKGVADSRAFRDLMIPAIEQIGRELLDGQPTFPMMARPQLLFTLPNADVWRVPHQIWHLDLPRLPDGELAGVQVFGCLNDIPPGGGATLIVAGSHRLQNNGTFIRSKVVKKRLKAMPWFRDLMSSHTADRSVFLNQIGKVGEVDVQVMELCGNAGDCYFVDMRTLHTIAPNAGTVPRAMVTQRFLREGVHQIMLDRYTATRGAAEEENQVADATE